MSETKSTVDRQNRTMQRYYVWQSKIYDATRWSFLFGRRELIRALPFGRAARACILEVGCGTGYNLRKMALSYPQAQLIGLDVSTHMLNKARQNTAPFGDRVSLEARPYSLGDPFFHSKLDAVVFSYSLTMINPQWRELLQQAKTDLKPGGFIAVTDFHDSRFAWFKRHMGNNHVRMDGHLLPVLRTEFTGLYDQIKPAYGGLWSYFVFVGKKPGGNGAVAW